MNNFNYTIIIPHHDIPSLLARCLNSIPTRDDLQIIVVDDKSDEETIALLKDMESKFSRAEFLFSDKNGGGGLARNIGLDHAKGKYVLFADADDYFNPCLNDILNDYSREDADIIFFGANSVDTDTYQNSNRADDYAALVNHYDGKNDFNFRYHFGVPWSKIIKCELIASNGIRFQETLRHNDVGFSYLTGFYANSIKVDKRAIYCITTRQGSVSRNVSVDALKSGIYVYCNKYNFLLSKKINIGYPEYISYALYSRRKSPNDYNLLLNYAIEFGVSKRDIKFHYIHYRFRLIIRIFRDFLKSKLSNLL